MEGEKGADGWEARGVVKHVLSMDAQNGVCNCGVCNCGICNCACLLASFRSTTLLKSSSASLSFSPSVLNPRIKYLPAALDTDTVSPMPWNDVAGVRDGEKRGFLEGVPRSVDHCGGGEGGGCIGEEGGCIGEEGEEGGRGKVAARK